MVFANAYQQFIVKEQRIPRSQLEPHNIYRISLYKYSEGKTENIRKTLFFSTGVIRKENKLYGIKLSEIRPEMFFTWAKGIAKNKNILDEEKLLIGFNEIAPPLDIGGKRIYESYLKNSKIMKTKNKPFRSYNFDGIKYVSKVFINKEILKKYYG